MLKLKICFLYRKMFETVKEMQVDVGFLDPQIFSAPMIETQSNFVAGNKLICTMTSWQHGYP